MTSDQSTRRAYGRRAREYADVLGSMEAMADADRRTIEEWAARVARSTAAPARILDAGCGPGHWTAHLVGHGHAAEGVDPVPEFIEIARRTHVGVPYRIASFSDLASTGDDKPGTAAAPGYDGILAWYSLIHSAPEAVPTHLRAFRSALRPGGRLLVGFVTGPVCAAFDHAVAPAYAWPVGQMTAALMDAGFDVESGEQRTDDGARPHGALSARMR